MRVHKSIITILSAAVAVNVCTEYAQAYIGPGAGIAIATPIFFAFASVLLVLFIILTMPARLLIKKLLGKRHSGGEYKRVIVLGLDGMDPGLTGEMMDAGELPNFRKLSEAGCFSPLKTSCPAMSPVAWSSFMTGVTAARHNIYDFLTPDRKTYFPMLSSSEILPPKKSLNLGSLKIPIGKPVMRLMRKGRPFWNILSDQGVFSSILRVPITFPPEPFGGHLLAAMCVPDLKGTQGTFALFTSQPEESDIYEGGERVRVAVENKSIKTEITGPPNTMKDGAGPMSIPMKISWNGGDEAAAVVGGKKIKLKCNEFSEWIPLSFKASMGIKVPGIVRFYLKSLEPAFELYMTPINIDPGNPALPVSHPFIYSVYLEKLLGPYSTLGLAEDTWALNERILDEKAFLEQCWLNHKEREDMFFLAMDRTKKGVVACVFDTTDRIQHMFWRYHEPCDHQPRDDAEKYGDTIRDLYRKMDDLLGRTMEKVGKNDALIVMSDHGFKAFRRGVDLNVWLEKEGYLVRKEDAKGEKFLKDVDWTKTKAYSLGLSGIYINLKGREAQGTVSAEDAPALREEIATKLKGLKDDETGETAVTNAFDMTKAMNGPYIGNAPDVFVGYNIGYRASWDCAVGAIEGAVFENNTKSWSGDHCIDPDLVPGILFSNLKLKGGGTPSIIDIAPSVLDMFGIEPPANMEGKPVFGEEADK
ncbi:alkaline phosphatase family protein [bacterium]